jgi:hypothetical protein
LECFVVNGTRTPAGSALLQAYAARFEQMAIGGVDVAVPELFGQA